MNSVHSDVHVIADHLGTIDGDAFTFATKTGAPDRKIDTRDGGGPVHPSGRLCFGVAGSPGDVALVNLTPVQAAVWGMVSWFRLMLWCAGGVECELWAGHG